MKVLGIIPVRYSSSRLPGKPLRKLKDKTLVQRVYENAIKSKLIDELIVATDDERIFHTVESFGGTAIMTPDNLNSGTDRVANAANSIDCDIVVNIQGDEPFISPDLLDRCIKSIQDDNNINVCTAARSNISEEELNNPDIVKVIVNRRGEAIYFSRQRIPYTRLNHLVNVSYPTLVHIGLYVYRKDYLLKFAEMPMSTLESLEQLEQLRIIEGGDKIKVVITDEHILGIDTPEDLLKAEKILQEYES
jgi:3-deoxy-manno-octulosonate cytidylyltransferase (CMP-KDO synthetase)